MEDLPVYKKFGKLVVRHYTRWTPWQWVGFIAGSAIGTVGLSICLMI